MGYSLLTAPQNRWDDEDGVGHALRSSGLVRLEVSRARVFQSGLKTNRGTAWMVPVVSSRRLCRVEAEYRWVDTTGCVGLFNPNFIVFYVLGPMGILVFCLSL
jgi:hypothetical protein